MDKFIYLLLGHLFGDFVLQNNFIASNKQKKFKILIFHVFLIFISQIVFFLGKDLNLSTIYGISFITFSHFIVDFIKFKNNNKNFFKTANYYLFDQSIHVLTLLIASFLITQKHFYIPLKVAVIFSSMIFNAYFLGIYSFLLNKDIEKYERDLIGYIIRGIIPIFYIMGTVIFSIFTLITGIFSIFFLKRQQVISWALSIVFTIIFLEVLL